jgi:hypothetical protein
MVWLSLKNIKTQRPSKKLDDRNVRCEVIQRIGRDSYKLKLPADMGLLHPVFHTSLLRPDANDPLPGQYTQPPAPVRVSNDEADTDVTDTHDEWEVEEIVDSRYSYGFLEYKVKWKGYPMEHRKWYRVHDFANAPEATRDFHIKYPNKPQPRADGVRMRQSELDTRVKTRNDIRQANLDRQRKVV